MPLEYGFDRTQFDDCSSVRIIGDVGGSPKRMHVVPKSYLKRFADNGRVRLVRRTGDRPVTSLDNVAVEGRFYELEFDDGETSGDIEAFLATDVDGPADAALGEMLVGSTSSTDFTALVRFLAFQMVRTQKFRDQLVQIDRHIRPLLLATETAKNGADWATMSREERVVAVRQRHDVLVSMEHPAADKNGLIRTMLRQADVLEHELSTLRWQVARADQPMFFTSDSPVSLFDPVGRIPPGFTGYVPPRGSMLLLPLDPQHVLIGAHDSTDNATIDCSQQLASTTRDLTVRGFFGQLILPPGLSSLPLQLAPLPEAINEPSITIGPSTGTEPTRFMRPDFHNPAIEELFLAAGGDELLEDWESL